MRGYLIQEKFGEIIANTLIIILTSLNLLYNHVLK
jgi:hypothetical protein